VTTDLYKYSPDSAPPIHAVLYRVVTDKPPPAQNGDMFRSILATIYNQSQLAEKNHVARYWSLNTAATAVPLSAHPSQLVITTTLAAAILGGLLFGGGVLPAQYCPCGCVPSFTPTYKAFYYQWGPFHPVIGPFYPSEPLPGQGVRAWTHRGSTGPTEHLLRTIARPIWPPLISL